MKQEHRQGCCFPGRAGFLGQIVSLSVFAMKKRKAMLISKIMSIDEAMSCSPYLQLHGVNWHTNVLQLL